MKRIFTLLILLLILFLVAFAIFFKQYIIQQTPVNDPQTPVNHPQTPINHPNQVYSTHTLGGFSIDTPEQAAHASADGIQVAFEYGQPPSNTDELGQKLQSLHMKVIDGYISSYLHYYECHRTALLKPSLIGPGQYCESDSHPELDENALLATIATHLQQEKTNPLISGYWVLDDWVQWDAGSAQQILVKIHDLIQQYTPGRPAICGFGGSIGLSPEYQWNDWLADNFSPQGCDEVGLYIYTPSFPNTVPILSSDAYNWSMSGILSAIYASLQQRGWNIEKEPVIGIGQAFGGPMANTDSHWVMPSAQDIEIQSKSFCEHGATGLTFYGWSDSAFGPTTQTPMNSPEIEQGIRNGIAACKQYWSNHPQP